MRILVTITPRMYREALSLAVVRHRPHLEVRICPPGDAPGELSRFRPRLLVRNDDEALAGMPS